MQQFEKAVEREDHLCLSSIVEFELTYGVANSRPERQFQNQQILDVFLGFSFERLAFDSDDGVATALIRSQLKQAGMPIGAYDVLIAGQALNNDCTLVTDNVREFPRITNLKWTNWKQSGA